jgi:hypothetical protein
LSEPQPLQGPVKALFHIPAGLENAAKISQESLSAAIELCRLEEEQMAGCRLVCTQTRLTDTMDISGRRVIEVYATFHPAADAPPEGGGDTAPAPPTSDG